MKKTIGSAALMVLAFSVANGAPAAKVDSTRMPAALPADAIAVGCKSEDMGCVLPVRTYTADAANFSTVTYSYCQPGTTVVSEKNLNFCTNPKPAML
jgi:hypothetical protein